MFKASKFFLVYSLIIISSITFINMTVLYWFPFQFPLSSYSAISLMFAVYISKTYCLIPITLSICVLIFFAALSFFKEKIVSPAVLFTYSLCDLFFLAYSFWDAWLNDQHLIIVQGIQLIISTTVIVFMCIYFILLSKEKLTMKNLELGEDFRKP